MFLNLLKQEKNYWINLILKIKNNIKIFVRIFRNSKVYLQVLNGEYSFTLAK